MTEEQKEKYANFLNKVSEILGLSKPVDILRLCAVTDEYLKPIEKRIADLEKENAELKADNDARKFAMAMSEKVEKQLREENAELKSIAEFQQSSNMNTHLENKKLKEGLAVGSTWNKALEEERDKYRNMVFDKMEQLSKAKDIIKNLLDVAKFYNHHRDMGAIMDITPIYDAEQFLKKVENDPLYHSF